MDGSETTVRLGVPILTSHRNKAASCGHQTPWRLALVHRLEDSIFFVLTSTPYCPHCKVPTVADIPDWIQKNLHKAGWPL